MEDWSKAVIPILLTIIGFFLRNVASKIENNTKILNEFSVKMEVLKTVVDRIKEDADKLHTSMSHDIKRHEDVIEMMRKRIHRLFNQVAALKLHLEAKGAKFHGESFSDSDD